MAPNDCFRNESLSYNLLSDIVESQEFDFRPDLEALELDELTVPQQLNRSTFRLTENVSMVLNILPPDFERCLMMRAEDALAGHELPPYVDPHPSNLSLEEARILIINFVAEGLIFSTEATDSRQFIEERFTELLLYYCEGGLEPAQHGLVQL